MSINRTFKRIIKNATIVTATVAALATAFSHINRPISEQTIKDLEKAIGKEAAQEVMQQRENRSNFRNRSGYQTIIQFKKDFDALIEAIEGEKEIVTALKEGKHKTREELEALLAQLKEKNLQVWRLKMVTDGMFIHDRNWKPTVSRFGRALPPELEAQYREVWEDYMSFLREEEVFIANVLKGQSPITGTTRMSWQ